MTRPTRGLLAQVSVVLAVVALAAVALAPRGMLRAAAAADLEAPAISSVGSPSLGAPIESVDLPGVRAVVSREEQDPHEALLDALATAALPGAAPAPVAALSRAVATDLPPEPLTATSANGDRAPPSSI